VALALAGFAITSNRKREEGTYTPMTDCFFGASLVMFVVG
jgi:hypothetical protein